MGNATSCDCTVAKPEQALGPLASDGCSKFSHIPASAPSDVSDTSTASGNHKVLALDERGVTGGRVDRHLLTWSPDDPDSSEIETEEEPERLRRSREGAVCAEAFQKGGYYKDRFWNKTAFQEERLFSALRNLEVLRRCSADQIHRLVRAMEIHRRVSGSETNELVAEQGELGDGLFVVLSGAIACFEWNGREAVVFQEGCVIDEVALLWGAPRRRTMKAQGECVFGKLRREDYMNLCIRDEHKLRQERQATLRKTKLLDMMEDEKIAQICDVLKTRTYSAGDVVIQQGEKGKELFIVTSGEAAAYKKTADDEQECMQYEAGDYFGERALISGETRGATVRALTRLEVLVLTRRQFERLFGSMNSLQAQQYLTDPRKLLADFYDSSDARGPRGSLALKDLEPDHDMGATTWFAVYRPTSKDAIAKMLRGIAVGKGLNVKGKSAKQGILSGFVPFVQISDNKHKSLIEESPRDSRFTVYYRTRTSRDEVHKALSKAAVDVEVDPMDISLEASYEPDVFGLELPEILLTHAYIQRPDLSPMLGWETGRRSEPFNMDANLHAARKKDEPRVVLYQHDEGDAMNPRGLLVAYAEKFVKPVVSDFDTFLVGSRGMQYEALAPDQSELVMWLLSHCEQILGSLDRDDWTKRWMRVLKQEDERGFHPPIPKYGFGDPTSYRLTQEVVEQTISVGAVRHGAECCNFYFPQELDDQYLVVWHGFEETISPPTTSTSSSPQGKPWNYLSEPELRKFLLDRVKEGFSFPLNPVWPVRDKGWYEVLQALRQSPEAEASLKAWFPPEVGTLDRIDELHSLFPGGFQVCEPDATLGTASMPLLRRSQEA